MPRAPVTTNQISMTGPNMPPIQDVPLRWIMNNRARISHRQRDDDALHLRGIDLDALDRAQNRNGRRDGAVAIEQGRPDEADHDHDRTPPVLLGAARANQSEQRQDAALAVVIGAHDQDRVFDGDDDDQ